MQRATAGEIGGCDSVVDEDAEAVGGWDAVSTAASDTRVPF